MLLSQTGKHYGSFLELLLLLSSVIKTNNQNLKVDVWIKKLKAMQRNMKKYVTFWIKRGNIFAQRYQDDPQNKTLKCSE